jgi:hypothetical protein
MAEAPENRTASGRYQLLQRIFRNGQPLRGEVCGCLASIKVSFVTHIAS